MKLFIEDNTVRVRMIGESFRRKTRIKEAYKRILPPGYKPEDYLLVDAKYPKRVAKLIVEEIKHIQKMKRLKGNFKKKVNIEFPNERL